MRPALPLLSGSDVMVPPRTRREVADLVPGADLRVLEGEAHQPFHEVPEAFDAIVTDVSGRVS